MVNLNSNLKACIKLDKGTFDKATEESLITRPTLFWSRVTNAKKSSRIPMYITDEKSVNREPYDIANAFADFFLPCTLTHLPLYF